MVVSFDKLFVGKKNPLLILNQFGMCCSPIAVAFYSPVQCWLKKTPYLQLSKHHTMRVCLAWNVWNLEKVNLLRGLIFCSFFLFLCPSEHEFSWLWQTPAFLFNLPIFLCSTTCEINGIPISLSCTAVGLIGKKQCGNIVAIPDKSTMSKLTMAAHWIVPCFKVVALRSLIASRLWFESLMGCCISILAN